MSQTSKTRRPFRRLPGADPRLELAALDNNLSSGSGKQTIAGGHGPTIISYRLERLLQMRNQRLGAGGRPVAVGAVVLFGDRPFLGTQITCSTVQKNRSPGGAKPCVPRHQCGMYRQFFMHRSHYFGGLRTDKTAVTESELPSPEVVIVPRSSTPQELISISYLPSLGRLASYVRLGRLIKASPAIRLDGTALHCFGTLTNSSAPKSLHSKYRACTSHIR